jgi:DNA-binding PadR family transcriptional regulator
MRNDPATKYVVMGALMSGARHGYEIMQTLAASLRPTWRVSTSQLYALLKRLQGDELVESRVEIQETRPSKRVFVLTDRGEKAFLRWLQTPVDRVRDFRMEFLTKLFFHDYLSLPGADALIASQSAELEALGKRIRSRRQNEKNAFDELVFGFKLHMIEGLISWLAEDATSYSKGHLRKDRNASK